MSRPNKLLQYLIYSSLISTISCTDCFREPNEKYGTNSLVTKFENMLKAVADKYASIPGEDMTISEMIKQDGYPVEIHHVTTEDGYVLTLHRIPGKPNSTAVLLQHGLSGSPSNFIEAGKDRAIAYLLADHNYDVWLGNVRGSSYSLCHKSLSTRDPKYWDFSWHEMGVYDIPASISYISDISNDKIMYIGHSVGNTIFFVMASLLPDISSKVGAMFAFGPTAFIDHFTGLQRHLVRFANIVKYALDSIGIYNLGLLTESHKLLGRFLCNLNVLEEKACAYIYLVTFGSDQGQFDSSLLRVILNHNPAGSSTKAVHHYSQEVISGHFRQYDYGEALNKVKYNSTEPPDYDLSKINVPIGLLYGEHDTFSTIRDVNKLKERLPNLIMDYKVPCPRFSHIDFIWGINVTELVYQELISVMAKYKRA